MISPLFKTAAIAVIILAGVVVRFYELEGHFAHYDDIGVAKSIFDFQFSDKPAFFAVAKAWTYAPFQFLITPLLVSMEQGYRELLFWGRLPSAVFGVMGLFGLVVFYRKFDDENNLNVFLALSILACSWEWIAAAKQMHNYALGVTAATGVLILFLRHIKEPCSPTRVALTSLFLGILTYMSYSIVLFIPAFFLTGFIYHCKAAHKRIRMCLTYALAGLFYIASIFPIWYIFLRHHFQSGGLGLSEWNMGWNLEYFLHFEDKSGLWEKAGYAFTFYFKNSFYIIQSMTGFISEDHALFPFVSVILAGLFLLGCASFIYTASRGKKYLGLFTGLVILTLYGLVFMQKFTLSPTRHNLILLPLFAVTIAEGFGFCVQWADGALKRLNRRMLKPVMHLSCSMCVLALFASDYPVFLDERRDPFKEEEILELVKTYKPDALITAMWSVQPEMMKSVRDYYNYYEKGFTEYGLVCTGSKKYNRLAWISHRQDLTPGNFERARSVINNYLVVNNYIKNKRGQPVRAFIADNHQAYRVIYKKVIDSNREVEFSRKTQNGVNGLYLYILEHI